MVAERNHEELNTPCSCGKCFYCYMHQDYFHTHNLEELQEPDLFVHVAEYVGPEVATEPSAREDCV